jgi:hypothetical protein
MMSSEDIKRLNLVEKLEAEVESLKAQLKEKEDIIKQESFIQNSGAKKWQGSLT